MFPAARGLLLGLLLAAPARAAEGIGLQSEAVFTDYGQLSSSAELMRRSLSPLTGLRLRRQAALSGQVLRDQPVDLALERFVLYLPAQAPPDGYALLVFVSPAQSTAVPSRWLPILDEHGMIFVAAAKAGNDASILDRREPLALLAAHNVMTRYQVDPQRVYVGGFSGGSRVALRLALGYPDLFHGALLEAGSDPIGEQIAIPPADLFRRFQESTRLVYLTGGRDEFHLDEDRRSRKSMEDWCVFDVDTETMPWIGHELADPASFNRALDALARHAPADPGKLTECRARIDAELAAEQRRAEDLLAEGKPDAARTLLDKIDGHYGGLAAPRSLDLAERLAPPR